MLRELDSFVFVFLFKDLKMASILLFVVEKKMFHLSLLQSIKHR